MKIKALMRYLPVLSIVLVSGTLLVIVIVLTLRNINSQNERMSAGLKFKPKILGFVCHW